MAESLELHQLIYGFLQTSGMKKAAKTFAKEASKVVRSACLRSGSLRLCVLVLPLPNAAPESPLHKRWDQQHHEMLCQTRPAVAV